MYRLPFIAAELSPERAPLDAQPLPVRALSHSPHAETIETILSLFFVAGIFLCICFVAGFFRNPTVWRKGISRLAWRPWAWRHLGQLLGTIVLVYLSVFVFAFGYHAVTGVDLWAQRSIALLLGGMTFHAAGLLAVCVLMSRRKLSWGSAFGITRSDFMHHVTLGGACYLAVLPLVALSSFVYEKLLTRMGEPVGPQEVFEELVRADSPGTILVITFLAIVLAPIFEEIVFRGLALPLLVKKFGTTAGIVLLSLVFALIHFHVASILPLFILSVALSLAYMYSQSIVTPIIMHALFNGINLVFFTVLKG